MNIGGQYIGGTEGPEQEKIPSTPSEREGGHDSIGAYGVAW